MSNTEVSPTQAQYEIIDHNIVPDMYVTYIVDLWEGAKNDPATEITRYIICYDHASPAFGEDGDKDPDFGNLEEKWGHRYSEPSGAGDDPLVFKRLETVKTADREAKQYKDAIKNYTDPERQRYSYGGEKRRSELYNEFMDAVDVIATDPDNAVAWAAIDAWKKFNAERHEK